MIATKKPNAREASSEALALVEDSLRFHLGASKNGAAFIASSLLALRERRSSLQCTHESIVASLLLAYRLGWHLSENGNAYLRTLTNSKTGKSELLVVPNYRGLVETMRRHSSVSSVHVDAVHERDKFIDRRGLAPKFVHEPYRGPGGRGPLVAAYAMLVLLDGSREWRVVYREDIDDVRPKAPAPDSPWCWSARTEGEMWCTVVAKKLAKWAPASPELSAAISLERAVEVSAADSPRSEEIAESLGIDVNPLTPGEPEARPGPTSAGQPSVLVGVSGASAPGGGGLRCCDCGNDDKIVVAHKIERLLTGELSIKCVEHESDSAHTHRLCPGCVDIQRILAAEKTRKSRAEAAIKRLAKKSPLSPSGSGVGKPAPEPTPTISEAMGVEPGSSSLAPDVLNTPLGEAGQPPVSEGSGSSSEPSLTPAPEASSEGTAKASEGVQAQPRESLSAVLAETIQAPRVEEPTATGEAQCLLGEPVQSSPVAEALKKLGAGGRPW